VPRQLVDVAADLRRRGVTLPPAPPPSAATATMRANRSKDTGPEVALRKALHRLGYRYRVGLRLKLAAGAVRPDIVFPKRRLAVFVDGCFWHGCPSHGRVPSDPTGYWRAKFARNRERDARVDATMASSGWAVLRIWEHEGIEDAVGRVAAALTEAALTKGAASSVSGASEYADSSQPVSEGVDASSR